MNDRLPRVPLVSSPVRAVHVTLVAPSALTDSQTRNVPSMTWLQRVPHSALPLPPGLPAKTSNGITNDCRSLRGVVARMSPVHALTAGAGVDGPVQSADEHRWIAPALLLAYQ